MLDFQKKKQLGILVKIAMVDEQFAELEKEAIKKISKSYGATAAELDEIFKSPHINEGLAPMSVSEKIEFMLDCMLVILADDMVTVSEKAFAITMAKRMGFKKEVVSYLIDNKSVDQSLIKDRLLPFLTH